MAENQNNQNKEVKPKPAETKPEETKAVGAADTKPKIISRANSAFEHHLFESDIQDLQKNVSYEPYKPSLKPIPHKHFFHSKDNRGRALHISTHMGGHYHEVTWEVDAKGNLIAKSGPPMRMVTIKRKDGSTIQQPQRVFWANLDGDNEKDDHTHKWRYVGSDTLSPNILNRGRQENRAQLAAEGFDVTQARVKPLGQGRHLTEEDGWEIQGN